MEERLRIIARKVYNDFNLDIEYGGDFEAFFEEYFKYVGLN